MTGAGQAVALRTLQLGLGVAGLVGTGYAASSHAVGAQEQAAFRAVNGLPDALMPVVWPVMQAGALGAVPVTAAVALVVRDRGTAARLLVSGGVAWAAAKGVKRLVRRARPVELVPGTLVRGKADSGLGFVSGHAAVSAALASAIAGTRRRGSRRPKGVAVLLAVPPVVGFARMYVGAHLPLDVAGGWALGAAVDALVAM